MKVNYVATAIIDDKFLKISNGKEYNILRTNQHSICIKDDCGGFCWMDKSNFHIRETPQIEVGSEWVNEDGDVYKIKYASDKTVVYGEDEVCVDTDYFLDMFKPKPKTVKMYFYTDCNGLTHAYSEPMPVFGDYKFTKEIEL